MFSDIWPRRNNLLLNINDLKICLKNRQINEPRQKQGKIAASRKFPAGLSTESVDAFALALGHIALQPAKESPLA
ncbi:MAG: hypothetical protein ACRCS3_15925 [Paracoccaceae bacterium]